MVRRVQTNLSAFVTFFLPPADAETPQERDRLIAWGEIVAVLFALWLCPT